MVPKREQSGMIWKNGWKGWVEQRIEELDGKRWRGYSYDGVELKIEAGVRMVDRQRRTHASFPSLR